MTVRVMDSDRMGKHEKIGQVVLDKAKVEGWLKVYRDYISCT